MMIEPFEIHIPDSVLDDLHKRIARTRWPKSVPNSGWEYGTDVTTLQTLVDFWQNNFDWRKEERKINQFPQFRVMVDDLRIHVIHIRSKNPEVLPLIITHGWPGSFLEHLKIAPKLQDSFHIVIPSLPGYGFSDGSEIGGLNPRRIAALWVKLMHTLGYERFITQGGDWGATVSTWIGLDAPESLIGIHLNYIPGSYKPHLKAGEELTDREKEFLRFQEEWLEKEGAYGHVQATKPQTLAYAMHDSPVGMAAWILEKSHGWSYCEQSVLEHFGYEELLNNIMIYWVTETFESSTRLYYEARKSPLHFRPEQRVNVPSAIARFAKEEPMPPREWVERGYKVCRWTEYSTGSHYAPLEVPDLLATDIIDSAAEFTRLSLLK
jgi:pimeloyl-ACP methyl ester carboxylesterase